jgi:hypothetical protein
MDTILFQQGKKVVIIGVEFYRVFMGTLLLLFVPGVCDGRQCTVIQNLQNGNTAFLIGSGINFLTILSFIVLYTVEIRRENRLNIYLKFNQEMPTDSADVGKVLETLTEGRRQNLVNLTKIYKGAGTVTILLFILNTLFSAYVIFSFYGNDKGPMILVTNTLFIGGKLYDIYTIVNAEKNVYLSAYIKKNAQFNDVVESKRIVAP